MGVRVNLTSGQPTQEVMQSMVLELISGYQKLLLIASSECEQKSVLLWKKILNLIDPAQGSDRDHIGNEIRLL
jgi:hypothetical protein